jgi:hypothetical protein
MSPEVGTPVPAVTSTCSTSGTGLTDLPRSWCTPSAISHIPLCIPRRSLTCRSNLHEAIGAELDPVEFCWTSDDVQRYHRWLVRAQMCGDRNPVHAEPDCAAAAGFTRSILPRLYPYGMM